MSKRSIFFLILIGLSVFSIKLIAGIPADLVFNQLNSRLAPTVQIVNPTGSVWSGQAQSLLIQSPSGPLEFKQPEWKLKAWRLLLAQAALSVESAAAEQSIKADMIASAFGTVSLRNVQATLNAGLLSSAMPMPAPLTGRLEINSDLIQLKGRQLEKIAQDSKITWLDAGIAMGPNSVELGDYLGVINMPKDKQVEIKLSDLEAAVKAKGDIKLGLGSPMKYDIDLKIQPTDRFPAQYQSALTMLGKKNSSGQYLIKYAN